MTEVRFLSTNQSTLTVAHLGALYVCSHLLDPELILISDGSIAIDSFGFHLQDGKVYKGDREIPVVPNIEEQWWYNEECSFDSCAESISDFMRKAIAVKNKKTFEHDFTDRYPYYGVQGERFEWWFKRVESLGMHVE